MNYIQPVNRYQVSFGSLEEQIECYGVHLFLKPYINSQHMNYQQIRKRLPEDFDPVRIWDGFQEPSIATAESYYIYAEDGGISVLWILNSYEEFVELMSCVIFKNAVPEGLDIYDTDDTDLLEEFEGLVGLYKKLKSEKKWDIAKCNEFINNDFDNDFGRYGFCMYELGRVKNLLRIDDDQYKFMKESNKASEEDDLPDNISNGAIWICKNYRSKLSPSQSKDKFLKYLSKSVVIN